MANIPLSIGNKRLFDSNNFGKYVSGDIEGQQLSLWCSKDNHISI